VLNAAGESTKASVQSVTTAAAEAAKAMPADFRVSITNAKGKGAYPISSFTYILIYKEQADAAKGKAIGQFLWWAIHDGQKLAGPLDYAPLPKAVVGKVEQALRGITALGKSVIASN